MVRTIFAVSLLLAKALAVFNASESATELVISNSRLYAAVNKSYGAIYKLRLDGQDLLGPKSGSTGIGPYLDCYCTPSGFYTPGSIAPQYKLIQGVDSNNVPYGGIVLSEKYPPTGQVLEQYIFLREGETGLHMFSRLYYNNKTTPFLRNLQEFRTLFRPNTPLWTDLITKPGQKAPLPTVGKAKQVTVQDATWYLGDTPEDPYVQKASDYFTKYTFSDTWRDIDAYGMYADGSKSADGSTFGAWLVMNTKDTYWGGPTHSDLTVDGIVYNYMVSNHHGAGTPNITDGYDRTMGPSYYHFNKGDAGTDIETLRKDAAQYASPTWNAAFYDSIAPHVPNYVPTSGRERFRAHVDLPAGVKNPLLVLSQNKVDYQDNVLDTKAYQYWGKVDVATGDVDIPMVKAGTYRMTIYGDGIFGNYIKDDVQVIVGDKHRVAHARWREETAGTEIWRIGTPDKSSKEYRHGALPNGKPEQLDEYLIYFGAYDFINDYPEGVRYTVGEGDPTKDLNYVHWSVFGGKGNFRRPERVVSDKISNWTILFDLKEEQVTRKRKATFTVCIAEDSTSPFSMAL